EGRLAISVELPVGTPLETTKQVIQEAEQRLRERIPAEEIEHAITNAGPEAWWRPGGSYQAGIDLMLVPLAQRSRGIEEVEKDVHAVLADIPAARIQVRQTSSNILNRIIRRGDDRLSVEVRGHDLKQAEALGAEITKLLRETPGVTFAR